jgi:hypothetical protein
MPTQEEQLVYIRRCPIRDTGCNSTKERTALVNASVAALQ